MTDKLNSDSAEAKLVEMLEAMANGEDDCVCDDYGLWETLCADMLSEEETERLAEHLDLCEDCRRECEYAHAAGVYKDTPFYARMDAYKNDPASEKDENWKKIARAFNPELASIESATIEPATDEDDRRDTRPTVLKIRKFENTSRLRVASYAAAALVLVVASLSAGPEALKLARNWFGGDDPADPVIDVPGDYEWEPIVSGSNEGDDVEGENTPATPSVDDVRPSILDLNYGVEPEQPAFGGSKGLGPIPEAESTSGETFENSQTKEASVDEGNKEVEGGAQTAVAGEDFTFLPLDNVTLNISVDWGNAVASFNDGAYKSAAKEFGSIIEKLKDML